MRRPLPIRFRLTYDNAVPYPPLRFDANGSGVQCECCNTPCANRFEVQGYSYCLCTTCGYTFLPSVSNAYTEVVYGDAYFSGGEGGYADYLAEGELHRRQGRYYGDLLAQYAMPGTLLDVGCASGATLQGFGESGWSCEGLEPNGSMAEIARNGTANSIHRASVEEWLPPLERRFDAVAMIQVVAHFRLIHPALQNAAAYLKRHGLLLVETWNARSLTARLLGAQWHEFNPPETVRVFTPAALNLLAQRYGLALCAAGRPKKYITARHAKSLLEHKRSAGTLTAILHTFARVLRDDLTIPYPAEDLFWHLYRLKD